MLEEKGKENRSKEREGEYPTQFGKKIDAYVTFISVVSYFSILK